MTLSQQALDRFHIVCRLGAGPRWAADAIVFRGPHMLAAALSTNREAVILTAAIQQWLQRAAEAQRGDGPLCLACEHEFGPGPAWPVAFAVIRPRKLDGAGHIMMIGICRSCASQ